MGRQHMPCCSVKQHKVKPGCSYHTRQIYAVCDLIVHSVNYVCTMNPKVQEMHLPGNNATCRRSASSILSEPI